jgi:hypothetical protein
MNYKCDCENCFYEKEDWYEEDCEPCIMGVENKFKPKENNWNDINIIKEI